MVDAGTPWWLTTQERRERLSSRFSFFCRCPRCLEPDPLRSARCPSCGTVCARTEPDCAPQGPQAVFWRCPPCRRPFDAQLHEDQLTEEMEKLREKTAAALEDLEEAFEKGRAPRKKGPLSGWQVRRDVADFCWRAEKEIGPGHAIVARATSILANCSMNLAHARKCFDGKKVQLGDCEEATELRRQWIEATLRLIAKQECVAAGCCEGGACFATDEEHATVYEAAELVAGACPFLEETDSPGVERAAFKDVCMKYLDCLRLMYDAPASAPQLKLLESILAVEEAEMPAPVEVME